MLPESEKPELYCGMRYQRMVFDSPLSGPPEMKIKFLLTRKA
jgi:hypothetical protein